MNGVLKGIIHHVPSSNMIMNGFNKVMRHGSLTSIWATAPLECPIGRGKTRFGSR